MKRILIILALILSTLTVSAQNFSRRGFALGADRDTLLYIIASPFDNWYITVGGGAQTFIGNELVASARQNKLNYNLKAEIGKWIIPDVAISLRFSYFDVDGQTQYGLHPFVDHTQDPVNENGYNSFHANALGIMGYVILDWTNFLSGYEIGRRSHLHVFSPIGLGFSMLHGLQRNPRGNVGEFRKNWELSYGGGLGLEYEVSQKLAICLNLEVIGSESTWDWSPYDNSYSRFDIMPTVTVGARFNLLKNVTKYNPYTQQSTREKVNHEFLSFGTHKTVSTLTGRIDVLYDRLDSMQNMSDIRLQIDSAAIDSITNEISTLQSQIDSLESDPYRGRRGPANVIEELINLIPVENIPATIVYFQLDKYDLDFNGRRRLQNFAKELSQMDDTVEFFIIGAADSVTGTISHNQWLSERRCEVAYRALVNNYHADPNQLIMVPVGGITEYEQEENNRMALVILRTDKTEEIIRRWTKWK